MNQQKLPWHSTILIFVALCMMWASGFCVNIPFLAEAALLLMPLCGGIWAYLWMSRRKKSDMAFLLLGVVGAYLAGLLTNGFSLEGLKLVFSGISFTNPFAALYPLLCLPFALTLMAATKWKLSRTNTIVIMSVAFALCWIAMEIGQLRFYYGANFVSVFRQEWKETEQLLVHTLLEVKIDDVPQYTEQQAWLLMDRMIVSLPGFFTVLLFGLSYLSTLLFRMGCTQNDRTDLLPSPAYHITVSFPASILYVILFFLSAFASGSKNLVFYGTVQNFLWMLLPVFCYLQIKRTFFRILHHQMDSLSWIYFALALFVTFTNPVSGLSMIAAFGAFGQITRYLLWNAQKKQRP